VLPPPPYHEPARKSQQHNTEQHKRINPNATELCGFRTKWGTDSDGKWGAVTTQVGQGFDGKWGTFRPSVVTVPHQFRNSAPFPSERAEG
jgi:hypothetical protein